MNKSTFFLLAFFISFSILGQSQKPYQGSIKPSVLKISNENNMKSLFKPIELKSDDVVKQKLDSTIHTGIWKNEFDYTEDGKLAELRYFEWKEGKWDLLGKEEHTFENDAVNLKETIINYNLDFKTWKALDKVDISYNDVGVIIERVIYSWKSGRWFEEDKVEYEINELGKISQQSGFTKEGNKWLKNYQYEYFHDSLGFMVKQVNSRLELDTMRLTRRYEFSYDEYGNVLNSTTFAFENGEWVYMSKSESNIEDNIEFTTITYSWGNEEWIKSRKSESMKDAHGNFIKEINSIWNGTEWINSSMTEFAHNNDYAFEDLIIPYSGVDHFFSHMLTMYKTSFFRENEWVTMQNLEFYYSENIFTSTKTVKDFSEVLVYPNPASDQISFKIQGLHSFYELKVYNIQGKLVLHKNIENLQSVAVHSLSEGLFFYEIKSDKNKYSGKLNIIH